MPPLAFPDPVWLDPAEVVAWLKLSAPSVSETALVSRCCAAAESQVQRYRPEMWVSVPAVPPATDPTRTYTPDAEVYLAATMLAGRLWRRRQSPGGIESFADSLTYVSRYDPEIERALRVGHWAKGRIG